MLRARLATAAVAIPLLLLIILSGPAWMFAVVVVTLALGGVAEYAVMAFAARSGEKFLTILLGSILIAAMTVGDLRFVGAAMALLILSGLIWTLLCRPDFEQGLSDLGLVLVGVLYVGFLAPHFMWLHAVVPDGRPLVIFVLAIGMAGDTGGYFVGRAFGRHKLMPRVSPGKTVEGAIGITACSLLGAALCKAAFDFFGSPVLPGMSWFGVLTLAFVMAVLGQFGDLSESVMKRTFQTKESGWFFPGHGGILDRLDSLLFPVTLLYYYLAVLR